MTKISNAAELIEAPYQNLKIIAALVVVYLVWGSTYLVVNIALESFPPFTLVAIRMWIAGAAIFAVALWRGESLPNRKLTLNAIIIGCLTLASGSSSVSIAQQWVSSGLTALAIASVPLWTAIFAALMFKRPSRIEWIGLAIGFGGVILLNMEHSIQAEPLGAVVLLIGPILWSFGSILSQRIALPEGWMAIAFEFFGAGLLTAILALIFNDLPTRAPTSTAILAMLYLGLIGSSIGFTAYMYLLRTVRPALATSYAYVNPVIAIGLGILFAGETLSSLGIAAMAVILTGVIIVVTARSKK